MNDQKGTLNMGQIFDVFASKYDAWYNKPFGKSAFTLEKTLIETMFKNLKGPFLEVGVGTGRFAQTLKIGYGTDVSTGVLKFAKQRGILSVKGTGESLSFVDSFFGVVFIIVTLCFVDNPVKVLKEASRVLEKDGAVILGLILKESPWASYYKEKGEAGNIFYKIAKFYSYEDLKTMSGKAGLKIVDVRSTMFQSPTENPLHFEPPKSGFFKEAGFVAVKLKKVSSDCSR